MSKLPKMPKAGGKKPTRVPIDKDMDPKPHTRAPKKSEVDLLERGRKLATSYIEQRDGLDPEIAAMVISSMEPEDINNLIAEANSAVIERTGGDRSIPETASAGTPENAGGTEEVKGATLPSPPAVDFLSVPLLAADEDFASLTLGIPELAAAKKKAEEMLKTAKRIVIGKAKAANTYKLTVAEWNVSIFEGGSSHIDGLLLIESGVDPAVVKKCTVKTRYWDVRVTPPGTPKGEANGSQHDA